LIVGDRGYVDLVQLRYRYRIYPSPGQYQALARAFGCARVAYNDCLRLRDEFHAAGKKITDTEVQHRVITLAKLTPERAWLSDVGSVVLVPACQDARRAYRNWYDSMSGKRKGRKARHPAFRRQHNRQSIRLTRDGFALRGQHLYVTKVGELRVRWSRKLPSVPSSVTVIGEPDGRFYASFVVERAPTPLDSCQLLRLIAEKAVQNGCEFQRIGRFVPTSQLCSACGARDGPKPLSVRTWRCAACGVVHDRDVNAARNILAAGRPDRLNACGGSVRPPVMVAAPCEAGTHRGAT
jgi:transposase